MIKTRNLTLALSCLRIGLPVAFDSGSPGWKKDADGKLVVDGDGNPVYVNSGGQEQTVAVDTITRLNGEAKNHRERAEKAEKDLKAFEGLDAKAAREAIDKIAQIDQKTLIDAGEVDRVKAQISETFTTQLNEANGKLGEAEKRIAAMTRENAFNGSKFVKDQIAVPTDMLMATFGNKFDIREGKFVPLGGDDKPLMSRKRAGEYATFDEALEQFVDEYPHKNVILKGGGHSGSGNGGAGGGNNNARVVMRTDFDAMSPMQKAATAKEIGEGKVTLKD